MIETDRLILRQWKPEDAEALFRYASDHRVSELALWPTHTSVEMSREVIEKIFMPCQATFAITLKPTDEPVGCIGLVPSGDENYPPMQGEREVGYWLGRVHWGKGFTSEALWALMAYARDAMELKSLIITTDSRNLASQRVAEKCGFKLIDKFLIDGCENLAFRKAL